MESLWSFLIGLFGVQRNSLCILWHLVDLYLRFGSKLFKKIKYRIYVCKLVCRCLDKVPSRELCPLTCVHMSRQDVGQKLSCAHVQTSWVTENFVHSCPDKLSYRNFYALVCAWTKTFVGWLVRSCSNRLSYKSFCVLVCALMSWRTGKPESFVHNYVYWCPDQSLF